LVVVVVGDPTMAADHDPCLDAAAALRHAIKPGATTLAYVCASPRRDPTTNAASAAGATSPRGLLAFLSALAAGAGPGGLSPAKPLVTAPVFRSPVSTRAVVAFAASTSAADL